ncbi:uncharacterized protein LOC128257252 [Drosophila gunungcola]|uniref:Uncharacterized protein n=1 Tax=Drosophila gunungcola TaxID=103775 RepID=A0A9P9YR19_9MUSC|nr:uncharacterized protein LOC128257252 [Drosophila gunungcola]KAI8041491.1 hypothetical protein M5D96_005756 [Drosophila gunungcola]
MQPPKATLIQPQRGFRQYSSDIYSSENGRAHATRFLFSPSNLLGGSRSIGMRFRTAIAIGRIVPPRVLGLMELNDDCLLMICEHLALGDQLRLMELQQERLCNLVHRLWSSRYAKQFDFRREYQLKLLEPDEQAQLLDHLGRRTRALINLPGTGEGCRKWLKGHRSGLNHLEKLTFTKSNSFVIQNLPNLSSNLVDLSLGKVEDLTPFDLDVLFKNLQNLRTFELRCNCKCKQLKSQYPSNLETLKLPACMVNASVTEIFQLPRLRQLTAFLCQNSGHGHLDYGKANGSATGTLSACLQQIRGQRNCRIVGLRLQCRLDDRMPVVRGAEDIFRLQYFAWHSQLTVHFDVADGSVKWLPQRPQAVRSLLRFLAAQASSLRELDFTRNAHATPTFLAQLDAHLKWAGGCADVAPLTNTNTNADTDADADADSAETNDLAFVELKLLHLPNEQTEANTGEMTAMRN